MRCSCRSPSYASGRPLSDVSTATRSPMMRAARPRTSSATSGFFFCGMMLDPVACSSDTAANPNSALVHSTSSSASRDACSFRPSGRMRSVSTRSVAEWTSSASAGHANVSAAISDAICSSARTMRALSSSLMIFCFPSMRACPILPRTSCVAMRLSSSSDEVNSRIFGSSDPENRPDQRGLSPTRVFSRTSCGTDLPGVPRGQFLLRHVEHGLAARAPQGLGTRLRAQRHAEDGDESLRRLVVEEVAFAIGGERRRIQRVRRAASDDTERAAVESNADLAAHETLRAADVHSEVLMVRREPEAVVDHLRVFPRDARLEAQRVLREHHLFEGLVRRVQDHRRRRLVDLARLDTDEAVLDLVDAADAVLAADLVEPLDERDAAELLAADFAGDTLAELDDDLARLRGRLLRIDRPLVDVARRRAPGVLEHASLDRAAP